MKENNNWDSYKRSSCNIKKAVRNDSVSQNIERYYKELHAKLVVKDTDEDIFNDAYLKMTYKYDPEKDFVEQFLFYFNQIKGAYKRDDHTVAGFIYELTPEFDRGYDQELDLDKPVKKVKESDFINDLKGNINNFIKKERNGK